MCLLIAAVSASCRTAGVASASPAGQPAGSASPPPIVQPGAPGEASRVITADKATDLSHVQFTSADVKFMQGMISHHSQAVEMTKLLKDRTASSDMRKLALRIEVSQLDEIKMMQRWLQVRGQQAPAPGEMDMHMHDMPGHDMPGMSMPAMLMPGMLTPEEM